MFNCVAIMAIFYPYNDPQFFILTRARHAFHLSALEATYIKTVKAFYVATKNSSLLISH